MPEQLTITTEIAGIAGKVTVGYRYYGSNNIELDDIEIEGRNIDSEDLDRKDVQRLYSCIRNHKLKPAV